MKQFWSYINALALSLGLLANIGNTQSYAGSVGNLHNYVYTFNRFQQAHNTDDALKRFPIGKLCKEHVRLTSLHYGNAKVYQATKDIYGNASVLLLHQGDYFYLDMLHKDHIEVFDKYGNASTVLNLNGTENTHKKTQALLQKRTIDPTRTGGQLKKTIVSKFQRPQHNRPNIIKPHTRTTADTAKSPDLIQRAHHAYDSLKQHANQWLSLSFPKMTRPQKALTLLCYAGALTGARYILL